ncbi:hypothetical protein [Lysinibacillus sp. fls2-241-R2A-57]|uniref:hypothetical protein n=1 Tax=Lysinibacillus sp. fls2-241-R2A-57 TaxID=3040292 RepID=UPI00255415E7|nr:hypothetical protein [Lysinibacillus sp. fls2-241-R2A-57]
MYKNIIDTLSFWIAITFLVISFFAHTIFNNEFSWKSLLNTDGLTLLGIVFTFLSLVALKIPAIKKCIRWILLKINYSQYDYRISIFVNDYKKSEDIESLLKKFEGTINNSNFVNSNEWQEVFKNDIRIKMFHRGIAANVELGKTHIYEPNNTDFNQWTITIDNISNFRKINENINYVTNDLLETLNENDVKLSKISLSINKNNSELELKNIWPVINKKNYHLNHSSFEITSNDSSVISVDTNVGITLTAKTKGHFQSSIEIIKDLLIF